MHKWKLIRENSPFSIYSGAWLWQRPNANQIKLKQHKKPHLYSEKQTVASVWKRQRDAYKCNTMNKIQISNANSEKLPGEMKYLWKTRNYQTQRENFKRWQRETRAEHFSTVRRGQGSGPTANCINKAANIKVKIIIDRAPAPTLRNAAARNCHDVHNEQEQEQEQELLSKHQQQQQQLQQQQRQGVVLPASPVARPSWHRPRPEPARLPWRTAPGDSWWRWV